MNSSTEIKSIIPDEIEAKSFAIIEEEFHHQTGRRPADFPPEQFAVIRRVIHATGDFNFAESLVFHPAAIQTALNNFKKGQDIVTDVNMVKSGINKTLLAKWGGQVKCRISDPQIAALAREKGTTRSDAAIQSSFDQNLGVIAIGNAPTALLKAMELTEDTGTENLLIIGVPVGFVNAQESKNILAGKDYPFITSLGRKGGSPVAAAIVNALMKLAV